MPLHPGLRGIAAQGVWGKKLAGEYRRSAESLAARGSNRGLCQLIRKSRQSTENLIAQKQPACQETLAVFTGRCPAPWAARRSRAGYSGDMRIGRGFTAARRKVSWLIKAAGVDKNTLAAFCIFGKYQPLSCGSCNSVWRISPVWAFRIT